ncbi:MAG: iron-containing alcohol dehydrogenase [Anaerolineaceae bacterium]|jgi:alcohol dehydrogenase class IV|nr:iron-containing alcohol dehydrogenase [Anaerolineaceae bacterium]
MDFTFATAAQIVFGAGEFSKLGELAASLGSRVLLVTGAGKSGPEKACENLLGAGLFVVRYAVNGEPDILMVQEAARLARVNGCDCVVCFGGGSVIDTGKAVSALLTNPGDPLDYLEVVGRGQPLSEKPAPCIAVPTTSGTGSEVTKNAVLKVPEKQVKVSLRSAWMIPDIALLDPELTLSVPPAVTASTGMDALTQVLEPFVSRFANPMTDLFCVEGMRCGSRSLRAAYEDGRDIAARTDMAWCSLLGGLALANGKLGAVHGFAGPLGGMFEAPHGAICARLLPGVVRMNVTALSARAAENPALARYAQVAQILTEDGNAGVEDGVKWLEALTAALRIPGLGNYGMRADDIPAVIEKARQSSSMKGNPIALTDEEMAGVLQEAL